MTKLLLVEDDNNLREIYEARLQAEGYTIVSAHDGEEALVVAKAEKPDLIISDVMMPKISGFEMLDILRNTDGLKDVKVIMLTALGQSDDQQRADRLGADRYLVKSQVTLEDIVKVAHDLLQDGASTPALEATTVSPESPATAAVAPAAPAPVAPAAEPTTTPTPVEPPASVIAEPPTDPAPSPVPEPGEEAATDAEPAATENAEVKAEIEDFVAGASSEPTVAEPAVEPVVAQPTTAPIQDNAEITAEDNKLVADAAETLEASTKPVQEAEKNDDEVLPEPKKVGGERVIEPIASEPKKDISDLVAEEEAKEASAQAPAGPAAIIVDDKTGSQAPAPIQATAAPIQDSAAAVQATAAPIQDTAEATSTPTDKVDPNNIAL
jgi:CheY-like chemotaxis protein